jgi:hypothetical protein
MEKPFPAYQGSDPYIFVSYAHSDAEVVYPELKALRDAGFNVWYDEGISPGTVWRDELAEHLASCSLFLFYISPRSVLSSNCNKEVNFALGKERPFLNVFLEKTSLTPGLEFSLSDVQAIEKHMLSEGDYRQKLSTSVRKLLPTQDQTIDDYTITELLQHSASFSRFKAVHRLLGNEVELLLVTESADSNVANGLLEEARWFASINHSGFQKLLSIGVWKNSQYFVLGSSGRVSLDGLMSVSDSVPMEFRLKFCHQLSEILALLETHEKVVSEFHPELFSVQSSGGVCLRFGALSHPIVSDPSDRRYASPEQIAGKPINIESNYYSLGLLVYEVLVGRIPYPANIAAEDRAVEVASQVDSFIDTPAFVHGGDLQWLLRSARNLLTSLLRSLAQEDPGKRREAYFKWREIYPDDYLVRRSQDVKLARSRIEAVLAQIVAHWEIHGSMDWFQRVQFLRSLQRPVIDSELEKKILARESLSDSERNRYWDVWLEEVSKRQREYRKYLEGLLPASVYQPIESKLQAWIQSPVGKVMWDEEKDTLEDRDFVDHIERNLM